MVKYFALLTTILIFQTTYAQTNVGIGTTSPNPNAILDLNSSSQGLLLPRLTSADTTSLDNPINEGMIIYNTTDNSVYSYDGSNWRPFTTGANFWGSNANDIFSLNTGDVGIGVTNPTNKLHINSGTSSVGLRLDNTLAGNTALQLFNNGTLSGWLQATSTSTNLISESTRDIEFYTNSTVKMNISGFSGNVGIGTNIITEYYQPVNTSATPKVLTISGPGTSFADNRPAVLNLHGSSLDLGDEIGVLNFTNLHSTSINYNFARISAHKEDANPTYSSLRFYTRLGAGLNEQMRITPQGSVGIGTSTPSFRLSVNGPANLNEGIAGGVPALYVNGAEALWYNGTYFSWGFGGTANYFADNVGIGTTTPSRALEINNGGIYISSATNNLIEFSAANFAFPTVTTRSVGTKIVLWPELNPSNTDFALGVGLNTQWYGVPNSGDAHRFYAGTSEIFTILGSGNTGIGTNAPLTKAHLFDAVGPTFRLTSATSATFSNAVNSGSIQLLEANADPGAGAYGGGITYDGSANLLKLQTYDNTNIFDAIVIPRGTGNIGIGLTNPSKDLHVVSAPTGTFDAAIYASSVTANNSGFFGAMVYDQGTTNFGVYAHSDALANTSPLGVNRGADGALVSFYSANTLEGQITVSGNTITYGAFTGVHYANSDDESIERGMLVSLNGQNGNLHDRKESEIVYGISKTSKANDSKVMGAYLGLMDPYKEKSADNPIQIMAVGNGDMWVVDNGRNIEEGDFLISSDLSGYAMLDKGEFDIANIIARVAQPINWDEIETTMNGKKVTKISVFFENFVINHKAEKQELQIRELQKKTLDIEAKLQNVIELMGTEVSNK